MCVRSARAALEVEPRALEHRELAALLVAHEAELRLLPLELADHRLLLLALVDQHLYQLHARARSSAHVMLSETRLERRMHEYLLAAGVLARQRVLRVLHQVDLLPLQLVAAFHLVVLLSSAITSSIIQ